MRLVEGGRMKIIEDKYHIQENAEQINSSDSENEKTIRTNEKVNIPSTPSVPLAEESETNNFGELLETARNNGNEGGVLETRILQKKLINV